MTTFLIDTHAMLWWLTEDRRLPRRSRACLADPDARVLVSAASAWEVAIKKSLGKLRAPDDFLAVVEESGFGWIPVTPGEAYAAGCLPMHHRDPFDRLIVAQALEHSAGIISRDEALDRYGVERLWS